MKKMLLFLMMFVVTTSVQAQTQTDSMVMVPRSTLTTQQRSSLQIQSAHEWVGLGKEVGEAVNSSLAAVTEQTSKFAETKIGKLTMFLVVWKIIGHSILGIVLALIIWFVAIPVTIWSGAGHLKRRVMMKQTIAPDKTKVQEWKIINDNTDGGAIFLHGVALAVFIGLSALCLFTN